jgi:O-antigen/teichoic acid export membrane protein
MAYRIPEITITMVIWVVGKVAFPVYAKLRDDPPALRAAFLSTLQYLSLLTVPIGVGLAIMAGPFVELFFGAAWVDAVPAMQALAVAGTVRSLGSHAGDVYKATNRADILVKLGIARAVILIPAMIWGAQFGIFGVAVAQIIVTAASTTVNLFIAGRVLKVSPLFLLAEFKNAAIGSLLMGMVVYMMSVSLPDISPAAVRVAILVVTGAAVYVMYMLLFNRRVLQQAWSFMISAPKLTETR